MKRYLIIVTVIVSLCLTGCHKNDAPAEDQAFWEANDMMGAVDRFDTINGKMKKIYESFSDKLEEIKEHYGEDYWDSEKFVALPEFEIDDALTYDAWYFNEDESFSAIKQKITDGEYTDNSGKEPKLTVDKLNISRLDAHKYMLSYTDTESSNWGKVKLDRKTYFTYDPNHDWMDIKSWQYYKGEYYLYELFEYARQGNCYIIQTYNERAYIVLNDDKSIKAFYYTRLNGENRKKYPATTISSKGNTVTCDYSDLEATPDMYNSEDTIFTHIGDIDKNWVWADDDNYNEELLFELPEPEEQKNIEDMSVEELIESGYMSTGTVEQEEVFAYNKDDISKSCFDKKITYEEGVLTFETYNTLSKKIERYSITDEGEVSKVIEDYMLKLPEITQAPAESSSGEAVEE